MDRENLWNNYFDKQVGSGLAAFAGRKFHGEGVWSYLSSLLGPVKTYIQRQGLNAVGNMAKSIASGESFKRAAKNQFYDTTKLIMSDGLDKIEKMKQKGKGLKRKRKVNRRAKESSNRKTVKRVKKSNNYI
jgi:hypothetical protein